MALTRNDLERAWYLQQLGLTEQTAASRDVLSDQFTGSVAVKAPQILSQQRSTVTMTNTTSDFLMWTPALIPASEVVGNQSEYRIKLFGESNQTAAGPAMTIRLKLSGTVLLNFSPCVSTTAGLTSQAWMAELDIFPETLGAAGTTTVTAMTSIISSAAGALNHRAIHALSVVAANNAGLQFTIFGTQVTTADPASNLKLQKASLMRVI